MLRSTENSRGTGPRPTKKNAALSQNDREGQALALWEKNAALAIVRAPGSVGQDRLILTRSGAGAPELQWARYAPRLCRSGSSEVLAYLPNDPDPFVIRRSQTTEVGPMRAPQAL